ncbi:MAG: hypothetical protein HYV90_03800 [Candidatus Woesebacteria bacterium]|nr:MAG: hypothetical protein HYV90_03800 [Candidatus Woesebacteria bacterium]
MNKVKPTNKQVAAINGIIEGKSAGVAMREAGYSRVTALNPKQNLVGTSGAKAYLQKLDKLSLCKYKLHLADKLADTTLNGLEATKLFGKDAIVHPDWSARAIFVKMLNEIVGVTKPPEVLVNNRQFNFFKVGEVERSKFNNKLKEFLRKQAL